MQGQLFVISAPSGAGKSSLISALLSDQELVASHRLACSVSHTTRPPRPGEVDGQHYHFVSKDVFERLIAEQAFFEYATVYDHFYGTSKLAIQQQRDAGVSVLLDIDWQGARQIKQQVSSCHSIFIAPPSIEELERRLLARGQDSAEVIARRMRQAEAEMQHADEFDHLILNDDFATSLSQLANLIKAG